MVSQNFRDGVSQSELMRHTETIGQWVRISGSDDERKAFDYIKSVLDGFGYQTTIYESDALIGYPVESRLEMALPTTRTIACNGYSLSPATPDSGITGEVLYVGDGLLSSYDGIEAIGKIVLSDGLAMPEKALASQLAGAIGHIHINAAQIHEMCISPVWGAATPSTKDLLPTVPAVSVTNEDGESIKKFLESGPVTMTLFTKPYRDWRKIPTLIADLEVDSQDEFVLFSGHVDSWHYGVMDNGTANATQLEVARLLAERVGDLKRSVRIAFWSGHSHGRYAGSAWYADEFWHELHDHCVCHVNIDSVGARGATVLEDVPTMAETYVFAKRLLNDVAGADLQYRRISRSSDQSFWGHGIPSLFGTFSEQEREHTPAADAQSQLLGASGRGGGLGWWWHTTEDLLDKIDPDNLERDARVYAEALWQLTTSDELPLCLADAADEITIALKSYSPHVGTLLDRTIELSTSLATALHQLEDAQTSNVEAMNALRIELARILIPINYTQRGPYDQDLALTSPPVAGIAETCKFGELDGDSDDYQFVRTQFIRERNRVEDALRQALQKAETFR